MTLGTVKSRTVLVLDCSEQCDDGFAGNEVSLSLNNGAKFIANKTTLTACVEGMSEYCRIVYDLFPESHFVSVVASGDKPFQLNGWNFSEQSLKQVLREFAFVRPEVSSNLQETLELAVQTLTEPTQSAPHIGTRCKFRIVLLLQHQPGYSGYEYQDGSNVIDVSEVVNYHISRINKGGPNAMQNSVFIQNCELLVLRLTDPLATSSTLPHAPQPKTVGKVLANLQYLQPSLLFDGFSDLAQRHHSLGRIKVTGIPMRETIPHAVRTFQDAILLFGSNDSDIIKGYNGLGTTKKKEIVVKWKSNDRRLNPDTLPCKSTHRTTPQIISSSSSICLMKHVCAGHPVFLVSPSTDSDLVTHALLLQGAEVILHVLHSSTPAEGLPLHIYSTSVDNYRVKEFVEIVDANILQPRPKSMKQPPPLERVQLNAKSNVSTVGTIAHINSASSIAPPTPSASTSSDTPISASTGIDAPPLSASTSVTPTSATTPTSNPINATLPADTEPPKIVTVLAPRNLERYTRYFPWTEGDSLLYNSNEQCEDLRRLLDPFKRNMLREYLNEEYVDTITELITRMLQFANANELRLFPNLVKSAAVRKEAYKKLWADCHNFAQVCASTPNHSKMVTLMERMWPEACGITPPAPVPTTPTATSTPTTASTPTSQSLPVSQQSQQPPAQQPPQEGQRRPSYQEIAFVQAKKEKPEPKSEDAEGDLWNQLEQSKKNVEEAELAAERERQMLATMPEEARKKRKASTGASPSTPKSSKIEPVDSSSLFSRYWAAQTSKYTSPNEFDGQIEGDQFQLYADLK